MGGKYYESELQYLREMGREFAMVHPSTAGLLAERGSDPDVERLLEGFAFLTARIRERVDDAIPAVVHGLTELLLPHYLRPVPATSIVQYSPSLKATRGVLPVPRGSRVTGKPRQGTACEFRTTQAVDLLPLRLLDANLDETKANYPVIRLSFESTENGRPVLRRPEGIRLLLHGDLSMAASIYHWMMRHFAGASIQCEGGPKIELGTEGVIEPAGFGPDEVVLPWPTLAQEGYRYIQEYFTIPHKFLFVDIRRFDLVEFTADRFELALTFDRPPALAQRLNAEHFRLFCTPIINLFEVSGDPVKRDPKVYEHLLRAGGINPQHMELYEVTSVVGIRQGQAERREYHPFVGFAHTADPVEGTYYTLRPTKSPIDGGIDTYLSIVTPRGDALPTDEEVLSFDFVCTNRSLPAELQVTEIADTPRGVSAPAPFKNISPVSVPMRPELDAELHWRLLSHMALNRTSLADPDVLKATLALYNFQKIASPTAGRANELKIESIRSIDSEPITRLLAGAPVRGVETRIEVEESKLGTIGEAFLFGCVLDEVFSTHVPLNSFNELHVILHPSGTELRWPGRSGKQRIL